MSTVTINGRTETLPDDPDALLVDVLRDQLALTGTKLVCGAGVCGACTVLLDGAPVVSCLTPARAAAGKPVTTVEGIGAQNLHPVQTRLHGARRTAMRLLHARVHRRGCGVPRQWRRTKGSATPSREEIGAALSGHLCRCGAYDNIFRAVAEACAGRFDGEQAGVAACRGERPR